jgi:oxygen-independent coproporphyrinogen-3 oxidase
MIRLIQNSELYNNDIRAMIMAFYPGVKIRDAGEDVMLKEQCLFTCEILFAENVTTITIYGDDVENVISTRVQTEPVPQAASYEILSRSVPGDYRDKETFRNKFKLASYELLSQMTGKELPWGDLTGVRPTKIAMAKLNGGDDYETVVKYYQDVYRTTEKKARLAATVAVKEKSLISDINPETDYCLYVGIPFCPSRCLYCSFTSYPIAVYRDKSEEYIEKLCQELEYIANIRKDKRLRAIYIGGGTPTSLDAIKLERLLSKIEYTFPMEDVREFSVEAGRPDSIDEDKLKCMKAHHVSRISINPQTMNDSTLALIGRAHTTADTVAAFELARFLGFDNINMDIIAGLPGENADSMANTLRQIKQLAPESLTVHSLAIKRAANLKGRLDELGETIHQDMNAMLDMVEDMAVSLGMEPYYMYRQKNIGGNLENVGYSVNGKECLYNILIMEEITDIIAAGAGGSTKLVYPQENRVERVENCKSVDDYISRFDEMLERKSGV